MTLEQRAKRGQMRAATDLRHPLTSQCQWRMPSPWGHGHINRSSIESALVAETVGQKLMQKQVDEAVNQKAIPRGGLHLHGTFSSTYVLLEGGMG